MKRLVVLMAMASMIAAGSVAESRPVVKVCDWGGTPAAPTGVLSIDRGLTLTPSAVATRFTATGALVGGGRCTGSMTFRGWIDAGSTCAKTHFHGRVEGLHGVATFRGPGVGILVHEFLYDQRGNIVGADQPLVQVPQPEPYDHAQDCATAQGFRRGVFSSRIELWG